MDESTVIQDSFDATPLRVGRRFPDQQVSGFLFDSLSTLDTASGRIPPDGIVSSLCKCRDCGGSFRCIVIPLATGSDWDAAIRQASKVRYHFP
jgi:hypothetical protein